MFDLFRSTEKAKRIGLTVLLGLVAISMLLYLIPSGGPMGTNNQQVIAEVGPTVVTVRDIELQIRSMSQGRQISPEVISALLPQIVEEAITDRALAYEAERLGFQVTDHELANNIRALGQVGDMSPQQYRQFIEQQMNRTVGEFENNFRLKLYSDDIQNLALEGAFVSPAEVEDEFKRRNQMIKLDYIAFDPAKVGALVKPTAQELKDYYEKNKAQFTSPETRDAQLIVADPVKIAESIAVTDTQIQAYYNSHKDQYRTKERVKARHILISILNKPADEVPKLKAKAQDILKQIKAGADFAQMAEKYSDDKSNASKGGDLGWVVRGQMVPEFEAATFALKAGQISDVVTTNYGFHIVQALEREDAHQQPLSEVKDQIVTAIKNQQVYDKMQALADQAHTQLEKAPQNAQQIASQLGLLFAVATKFKSGQPIPELGSDLQLASTITSMQKGAVSPVMQSGQKLVIVEVTSVNPAHPASFEEAQAQVRDGYIQEKGSQLATEKANKAGEIVKTNGGDLKAAAKAVGLEVKTTSPFNRAGSAEGIGDARYLGDAFDKPIGTVIGPLNVGTQTVIAKIVERNTPDIGRLEAERESIVLSIKQKKSAERASLTRDSVLNYLIQKGKVKIHQDVLDRLRDRYRSS